jgi:hypothetical protein
MYKNIWIDKKKIFIYNWLIFRYINSWFVIWDFFWNAIYPVSIKNEPNANIPNGFVGQ